MPHERTTLTLLLATLVMGPSLTPTATAELTDDQHTLLLQPSLVEVRVTYADGIGSTKMGFIQFEGSSGEPDERFSPDAECTEWIGTFTQVLVEARAEDHVATSRLVVSGHAVGERIDQDGTRFDLNVLGSNGAWQGSLLVCDGDPDGDGLVRFTGQINPLPLADTNPALVHLTQEATP